MTTATSQRTTGNGSAQAHADPASLLDQVLANTTAGKKAAIIKTHLDNPKQLDRLRTMLPPAMRNQAERFVNIACFTFARKAELDGCTPESFLRCVFGAAQLGLAIDGRLAHAVPFNTKKKVNGVDQWVKEATLIVSYIGLVCVARRSSIIRDAWADVVCEFDHFRARQSDGEFHLEHEHPHFSEDRGAPIGAYACVKLSSGDFRYELMSKADIEAIRMKSQTGKTGKGPWAEHAGEMWKKTPLRRILKTLEDPELSMIALVEAEPEDVEEVPAPTPRRTVREMIVATAPASAEPHEADEALPPSPAPNPGDRASDEMIDRIGELARQLELSQEEVSKLVKDSGAKGLTALNVGQAAGIINQLEMELEDRRQRDREEGQ